MLEIIKKAIPKDKTARLIWISLIILSFLIGWKINTGDSTRDIAEHNHEKGEAITYWTCSMHPQIQQPEPGQCPICGMDLIPVTSQDSHQLSFREIALSDHARKLAKIRVAPVERKFVSAEIRMVGKIDYDETRLGYITARVPGRIDRMYVDYTGITVRKGDHLLELYSPELVSTQQELIQTIKSAEESGLEIMEQNVTSIRERLRLWGLTSEQISAIERSNRVTDHVTIYAPMGGIVIKRNGLEGMYVNTGTSIYTIADLSSVWLQLDAYESDVQWIRYGQEVEFETETFPGEIFKGKIAFIDPVLNEKTRTVKVRVNVDNQEGKLKPGMFAHATVQSKVAAGGKIMDPNLSGKWICPMHPEIVKDGPGTCDICGMPLVRAEQLGYVSTADIEKESALVIPASAPLITGKRAIVYLQVPGKEGVYEGREVLLGPRAGDYYIVKEGLREGEIVVVNGNFKIDSAIQILAKPSMMNPEGGVSSAAHQHDHGGKVTRQTLTPVTHEKSDLPFLLYHCPMAFDSKGADWPQNKEGTENPYLGNKMFKCGTQEAIITHGDQDLSGGHQHE